MILKKNQGESPLTWTLGDLHLRPFHTSKQGKIGVETRRTPSPPDLRASSPAPLPTKRAKEPPPEAPDRVDGQPEAARRGSLRFGHLSVRRTQNAWLIWYAEPKRSKVDFVFSRNVQMARCKLERSVDPSPKWTRSSWNPPSQPERNGWNSPVPAVPVPSL